MSEITWYLSFSDWLTSLSIMPSKSTYAVRREGVRDWVEKRKGLTSTDGQLQDSHGAVKSSMGDTVSEIVITVWSPVGPGNLRGTTL